MLTAESFTLVARSWNILRVLTVEKLHFQMDLSSHSQHTQTHVLKRKQYIYQYFSFLWIVFGAILCAKDLRWDMKKYFGNTLTKNHMYVNIFQKKTTMFLSLTSSDALLPSERMSVSALLPGTIDPILIPCPDNMYYLSPDLYWMLWRSLMFRQ